MVKPVPGKVYLASADGPEIELVALPHGDFQEIGWLDAPLTTDAPQTYSNHAGSKAIDVSFADAAKLTTSISFDAVHAPPLALYWGVGMPAVPGLHDLTPVYTGEAALAPADQAAPTSFPKPSLDGLVKPPTPAQKKMLDGVALTSEEEEETSTPLLTDALISQSLKESFLGPGWVDAGYITEPEPLKWDDLVAAFKPVQAGLKKMHVAFESSVKALQKVLNQHSVAISNAYDQLPTPYSGNPFAPKDVEVTDVDSNSGRAVSLRRLVPGIDDVVKLPCFHGGTNSIWLAIQHLNDYHNPNDGDREPWTREAIADWLETLDADLRVADAPVLRREDWVRGRISGAVGQVVVEDHGDGVVVKWRRSGYQQTVNPRDLVLIEAPVAPKKPAAPMNQTWQFGQVVKDPKTGLTGTIVEVKTYSTALVEPDVIELKIAFVPPVGTVIMPASAVQKVEPEVHLPQDELKDWPPEIILDEPLSWQSYGVDSWPPQSLTAHGKMLGDVVHLPQGAGQIAGYDQTKDLFHVLLGSGQSLVVTPQVILLADQAAAEQGGEITSWQKQAEELAKAAVKAPTPHILAKLTGSTQPPLSCGDVVRLASEFSSLTGKVVQYQVDSNTDPMTITYTVEWGPGGPNSAHSRDELVLVQAYKPPSEEILDWGSNKIIKNVY